MFNILIILAILASILLILIVAIQNPKGGGLASNFSSSNQYMGVRKTADFLEKSTWTLAIVLLVLSLFRALLESHRESNREHPLRFQWRL